jgi:hypothetical protein
MREGGRREGIEEKGREGGEGRAGKGKGGRRKKETFWTTNPENLAPPLFLL